MRTATSKTVAPVRHDRPPPRLYRGDGPIPMEHPTLIGEDSGGTTGDRCPRCGVPSRHEPGAFRCLFIQADLWAWACEPHDTDVRVHIYAAKVLAARGRFADAELELRHAMGIL